MTMVVFKAIRSSKLKDRSMRLGLLSVAHRLEREIKKDFQGTTKTWDHQPEFTSMVSLKGGVSVLVGTDDEIYNWVSNGTPEHEIGPVDADYLVFQPGYTTKTVPG